MQINGDIWHFLSLAVFSTDNTSIYPVLYIVDWEMHWNDSFAQYAYHELEKFLNASLIEVIWPCRSLLSAKVKAAIPT